MSYTYHERFVLYRLEAVQRELGVDMLTWAKLLAGYELKPKMTTYNGYTGMTLEEKNRIVQELRARVIELGLQATKAGAYPNSRIFNEFHTLYDYCEIVNEALPLNDPKVVEKILDGYKPSVEMTEHGGHKGYDEAGKNKIIAEMKKQRAEYEAEERRRYLEQIAATRGMPLPCAGLI